MGIDSYGISLSQPPEVLLGVRAQTAVRHKSRGRAQPYWEGPRELAPREVAFGQHGCEVSAPGRVGVDNEGETAGLEVASHVEYLTKWVDCAFLGRPDDGDYSIHWFLFPETVLKALPEL